MFRQYSLPQPSPIQPLSGVKFRFSSGPSRASLRCLCRPAWVSFFFFCLSPVSLSHFFLSGGETSFLSPGVGRRLRIRSQLGHTPPTGLVWGLGGVASLPGPLTGQKSPHRAKFVFLPRTSLPLPLKGEGRGITFLGLVGFALLVQNWGTLAQQGRSGASLVSFPYPVL